MGFDSFSTQLVPIVEHITQNIFQRWNAHTLVSREARTLPFRSLRRMPVQFCQFDKCCFCQLLSFVENRLLPSMSVCGIYLEDGMISRLSPCILQTCDVSGLR